MFKSEQPSLLFEKSRPGRRVEAMPAADVPDRPLDELIPREHMAEGPPPLPELGELDVVRHYTNLSSFNMAIDANFYPLGSCTMKYNPKRNERLAALPGMAGLHPYQDESTIQGMLELLFEMQRYLAEIAGLHAVSLQPAAGAQGELTALMVAAAAFRDRGERRTKVLVPDSAHGTNPASAQLAGFRAVTVKSDARGLVDLDDFRAKLDDEVGVFMITNPNTVGLFDPQIGTIAELLHERGALLYLDGANMNAILGVVRPGDMGVDLMHYNPHKTFSGPHGGGGPGAGPIAVRDHLAPYLPAPLVGRRDDGTFYLDHDRPKSIGRVRAFFGNVGVLVRAYCYIRSQGPEGLKRIARARRPERELPAGARQGRLPGADGRPLHARVRRLGAVDGPRPRGPRHGHRQAADRLRLPRPDGLLPADRLRGPDDRADRERGPRDARGLRRGPAGDRRRGPAAPARRPGHDADQPARRGGRRQAADPPLVARIGPRRPEARPRRPSGRP